MRTRRIIVGLVTTATALSGCGAGPAEPSNAAPTTGAITEGAARTVETTTTTEATSTTTSTVALSEEANGALIATMLVLGGSDVEAAIADGIITPSDLEQALAAIETRSLDDLLES